MWVPLHSRSVWSSGCGAATCAELASRMAELSYPAAGLTDVENLHGAVEFSSAARSAGVRPIHGIELRAGFTSRDPGRVARRLVLLVEDSAGWRSACRIAAQRRVHGREPAPDPLGCLSTSPRGLVLASDDASVIADVLSAGVDRDDVRLLLVRPRAVGTEPKVDGVPAMADLDFDLLDAADAGLRDLLFAIHSGVNMAARSCESLARVPRSPDEVRELFRDVPEALAEAARVADRCRFDLRRLRLPPPRFANREEDSDALLERACRERFEQGRRAGRWTDRRCQARLDEELACYRDLGYSAHVLAAAEIAARARALGMLVAARGSASSSLAVHVLGLGEIDPLAHGLIFERFLRRGRAGPPDIDLDVPARRREELVEWVAERFRSDRVAQVVAHARLQRRSACREGWLALGVDDRRVARICARADEVRPGAPLSAAELAPAELRDRAALIERLVGKPRHVSTHPGGVVISGEPLELSLPLERAPKGVVVTQLDLRSLQELGIVKLDLLGNLALGALQRTEELAGTALDAPDGDPQTLAMLRSANTIGCFQVETPALRSVLRRMPVRGIDDLMAALAIVRPGPASGEAKEEFLRRARGESGSTPPHPRLREALAATHGMLLYEEDVIASIAALTGWPFARADAAREELIATGGEAAPSELLEAAAANGIGLAEAEAAWGRIARLASYSFNKAHAASYARIAWRTAFARARRPAEFACAVLEDYGGAYPLRSVAAAFARDGVRILVPDVERSGERNGIEAGAVRLGLAAISGLTKRTRRAILGARPFAGVADLLRRAKPSRRELEALVLCGACDSLPPLAREAYPFAHEELLRAVAAGEPLELARTTLQAAYAGAPEVDLYRRLVRAQREIRCLRMHVSEHPLSILRGEAERFGCVPIRDLERLGDRTVRLAGLVAAARRVTTRDGRTMQFVTLEDEHGTVEAVLWPEVYERLSDPVTTPGPFLATGRIEVDHTDPLLVVSGWIPFHERSRERTPARAR